MSFNSAIRQITFLIFIGIAPADGWAEKNGRLGASSIGESFITVHIPERAEIAPLTNSLRNSGESHLFKFNEGGFCIADNGDFQNYHITPLAFQPVSPTVEWSSGRTSLDLPFNRRSPAIKLRSNINRSETCRGAYAEYHINQRSVKTGGITFLFEPAAS